MSIANFYKKTKQKLNITYSMQFRFLATVIVAMLAITVFIGGISIYEVDNYIQGQAEEFVNVTCTNESAQINDSFANMEKSVKIMESYLMDFFKSEEDVENPAVQEQAIISADQMFVDVAKHTSTSGAIAYYFRFDPAISNSKSGLFYSKLNGSDEFLSLEPTDISLYEKTDTEHVGWFWEPYEAGKPIWMKPYHNQNNNILMISYVVPMYFNDKFIGIVGMDFDYNVLANQVHGIKIYENGFAHLESDGVVICNDEHESDAKPTENPENYLRVSEKLVNGMSLVLYADYNDIRQIRYEIAFKILFVVIILSVLFTIIAIFIVKKIVDPLKKLTAASVQLSNGDYGVEIAQSNTHEIKVLSAAFENMTMRLREREELLKRSANYDSLTGLQNTTAYTVWLTDFKKEIESKKPEFGVVFLDLNDLKKTNDKYGHKVGDALIIAAAKIISETFKDCHTFRIGGDEFLVVLQNCKLKNCQKLFEEFNSKCANTFIEEEGEKIPVHISSGFAKCDYSKDSTFIDVFKHADEAMYENKRKSKATSD